MSPTDAAWRDIDDALHSAERAADDIALGLALCTKANALHQDLAQRGRGYDLIRQVREMVVAGRYYAIMLPAIDARLAEEMLERGDNDAMPLLRASLDDLYSTEMRGYCISVTNVLVEALLESGTDNDIAEAEAAIDRLTAEPVLDGSAYRDIALLRLRALLARARGDETGYRDFATRYHARATSLGFEVHIAIAEKMVGADGIEPPTAGV